MCVAAAVLLVVPALVGSYGQQVGYRILQLAALAQAWNLLAGYGGLVSLGSAAFIGLGAYGCAEVSNRAGAPLPLALATGAAVAAVFAVVVSPALFRLRGLYFTIGTLALAEALRIYMVNTSAFGGATGVFLDANSPSTQALYYLALAVAALTGLVVAVLLRSRLALALRAVRDDEDVAREVGVVTFRVKLAAFTVAGALMGLVGGLQALKLGAIEPYGAFGLSWTVDIVTAGIIGGLGSRTGPWLGAAFSVLLAEALAGYPELHTALTGAVLILLIRFAPRGLWGWLTAAGRALVRRSSHPAPVAVPR